MNTEEKNRYFSELTLNLRHEGLTVGQPEDGLLPIESDGKRFCLATDSGGVRYWREDIDSEVKSAALDKVTGIVRITAEYMRQLEAAPFLKVKGLSGDYRLLADFNDTVLAGHPTQYGVQFVTWDRVQNRIALDRGNYYGPCVGIGGYTAAKQDFATRSGLIPYSALFTPEQMKEIYRCIAPELDRATFIADGRQELLEALISQLKDHDPHIAGQSSPGIISIPERQHTEDQLCETVFYLTRSAQRLEQNKSISVVDERELFEEILGAARRFEQNFGSASGEDYAAGLDGLEGWLMGTFPYSEALDDRRQHIVDFVRFEAETSNIWPWALSADEIIQNEKLLGEVERIVEFDQEDKCDTDELFSAIDRLAGINPALKISGVVSEPGQGQTLHM